MSHTYRRRDARYEHAWVLRECGTTAHIGPNLASIDPHSDKGRKLLARYHADGGRTSMGGAPRWYRKVHDHRLDTANDAQLRRAVTHPDHDPVFHAWHRHSAGYGWW